MEAYQHPPRQHPPLIVRPEGSNNSFKFEFYVSLISICSSLTVQICVLFLAVVILLVSYCCQFYSFLDFLATLIVIVILTSFIIVVHTILRFLHSKIRLILKVLLKAWKVKIIRKILIKAGKFVAKLSAQAICTLLILITFIISEFRRFALAAFKISLIFLVFTLKYLLKKASDFIVCLL